MRAPAVQKGFTLIEILIAAFVLTLISAGLLAATWRLVSFARDEAEHMAADALCHDIMWAVCSMRTNDLAQAKSALFPNEKYPLSTVSLPSIEIERDNGTTETVYPLWRDKTEATKPAFKIEISGDAAKKERTITVTVLWTVRGEEKSHPLTVKHAMVERGVGGGSS